MKHTTFIAGTAVAAFIATSAACAADLPYKAAPAPPPTYNWTGFYVGANIGGATARTIFTDNATVTSVTGNTSGVIGGGTFGYNWQFAPNWVIGIEGTFDGTSISKTPVTVGTSYLGLPVSVQGSASTNWITTIAARIGVVQNNWLVYAKGGGGWANNAVSVSSAVVPNTLGWAGGAVNATSTTAGALGGVGIEYGFTPNWTVKVEYNYLGLANWTASAPFAPGDSINVGRHVQTGVFGVNYKF